MKKYFIVIIIIGIVLICSCVSTQPLTLPESTSAEQPPPINVTQPPTETPTTQQPPTNFLTYSNPDYGIKINYPQDWIKKEGTNAVVFSSPEKDATLEIYALDILTQPVTLNEYTQSVVTQCKAPDCNIIDSSDTTLANNPAHKLVYTKAQQRLTLMSVYTMKNNKLYFLTYTAGSNEYSKHLDKINEMIDSFEII